MHPPNRSRPPLADHLFTLGSASLFLGLMAAVAWALAGANLVLK